ncbi:hypothetical protein [Lentibacillus sp. CBA3610]|uniref:hypothetical protein n=1 Tax=Lentibacillus sp. CBA3610 TaxID=2518176 RepID=UPI001595B34D|nr:hypothetical protein [Lentibacillus sp. CBA3610]QKY69881.1 hypothetical protein Len3610_10030 [Lentibacillus sp. CBA3610]
MPWELRQVLLVIHILLAIIWVGGILFIGWGVYPAVLQMSFIRQRQMLLALMQWSHKFLTAAGAGVILTGIMLGTVFGPISEWSDIWDTRYGNIWVSALIIGVITLIWGVFVGYKQSIKVLSHIALWQQADSGDKTPLLKALAKIALLESVEVAGFIALISLMVLL